eukprot:6492656-Amphidinium_carterae.1
MSPQTRWASRHVTGTNSISRVPPHCGVFISWYLKRESRLLVLRSPPCGGVLVVDDNGGL